MRNVISTNESIGVTEEYSDAVRELLDGNSPHVETLRETYALDEIGQKEYHVRVVRYPDPGAGERAWAVDYCDPASREVEETNDPVEATARYEYLVRSSSSLSDDPFDSTDVPGVAARENASGRNYPQSITVDITDALRAEGANWAEVATDLWVKEAQSLALDVEVVSTEVAHVDNDAAVVRVGDRIYVLEVKNNVAQAVYY